MIDCLLIRSRNKNGAEAKSSHNKTEQKTEQTSRTENRTEETERKKQNKETEQYVGQERNCHK